jgi:hypothetical protein
MALFPRRGQVMILAVVTLGATIIGATTVAGLLTVYQVRQSADVSRSAQAIFAADAGIEWGLYQFFKPTSLQPPPALTNGATFVTTCYDGTQPSPYPLTLCTDPASTIIRGVGTSGKTNRAFEFKFSS